MPDNFTEACTTPCLIAPALNTVEVSQRPVDALGPGQVRVKTAYSMVSPGTELHRICGTHTQESTFPRMTGYIAIGHVVGLGEGVSSLALGQRVLFKYAHMGMANESPERCTPIGDGVDSSDAVCTPLLAISLRGVRAGKVQLGDSVAVFGQGIVGVFATHLAKLAGACPVIAVDPIAVRREVALKLGADVVIDPTTDSAPERIRELTDGVGVRVSIEATATPKVIASLPAMTAAEGKVIVLGGVHGLAEMDLYTFFQKSNQTMIGCGSPYHGDWPYDSDTANFDAIGRMMQAGMIQPGPAVTHHVPYTEGPAMYKMLMEAKGEAIGVQFDWTDR